MSADTIKKYIFLVRYFVLFPAKMSLNSDLF